MKPVQSDAVSTLSPFRQRIFATLWIAQMMSNIGTWMQSTAAAWMMTGLDPSPVMVALVQTAANIPVFFLGLSAGAVADIGDRRKLLIFTQVWMAASAGLLAFLTMTGAVTPFILLLLTFSLGIGSALMMPGFQAIMHEIVGRNDLPSAVTLNSVSYNIARSVGPALGGIVVAVAGPGPVFVLNALSVLVVIAVLVPWKQKAQDRSLPTESFLGALSTGIQYTIHARDLRDVLVRTGIFIIFGSAIWALVPLVARFGFGTGAEGYGILLAAAGTGSLAGAVILPWLRRSVAVNTLLTGAELAFAAVTVALGYLPSLPLAILAMFAGGIAWLVLVSNYNILVQTVVPAWVQARALGMYWMIFVGGMAIASALWGCIADIIGVPATLALAGIGLALSIILTRKIPVKEGFALDMSPAHCWSGSHPGSCPGPDAGPVFVTRTYRVDPAREIIFLREMQDVRRLLLRDGARDWKLVRDLADPSLFVEVFMADSWTGHLRQHERITIEDLAVERRARAYRADDALPVTRHFIAADIVIRKEPGEKT